MDRRALGLDDAENLDWGGHSDRAGVTVREETRGAEVGKMS